LSHYLLINQYIWFLYKNIIEGWFYNHHIAVSFRYSEKPNVDLGSSYIFPSIVLIMMLYLVTSSLCSWFYQADYLRQGEARYSSTRRGHTSILRNQGRRQLYAGLSINYMKVTPWNSLATPKNLLPLIWHQMNHPALILVISQQLARICRTLFMMIYRACNTSEKEIQKNWVTLYCIPYSSNEQ
jgi:solute carrier family 25 protein 16